MYLLWHIAMGGWFTTTGNYGTDPAKAQLYEYHAAMALAKRHLTNGQLGVIVVARSDVDEVLK